MSDWIMHPTQLGNVQFFFFLIFDTVNVFWD